MQFVTTRPSIAPTSVRLDLGEHGALISWQSRVICAYMVRQQLEKEQQVPSPAPVVTLRHIALVTNHFDHARQGQPLEVALQNMRMAFPAALALNLALKRQIPSKRRNVSWYFNTTASVSSCTLCNFKATSAAYASSFKPRICPPGGSRWKICPFGSVMKPTSPGVCHQCPLESSPDGNETACILCPRKFSEEVTIHSSVRDCPPGLPLWELDHRHAGGKMVRVLTTQVR